MALNPYGKFGYVTTGRRANQIDSMVWGNLQLARRSLLV